MLTDWEPLGARLKTRILPTDWLPGFWRSITRVWMVVLQLLVMLNCSVPASKLALEKEPTEPKLWRPPFCIGTSGKGASRPRESAKNKERRVAESRLGRILLIVRLC